MRRLGLGLPQSVPTRAITFAAGSALVMLLRVFDRGEPISPRTLTLAALAFLGAATAGLIVFWLAARYARRWTPFARFLSGGLLGGLGATGLLYLGFAILTKFIQIDPEAEFGGRDVEHDPLHNEIIGMMLDALGLFIVTGYKYYLPWPMLAVSLLAGWLCALPFQARRATETARPARKPSDKPRNSPARPRRAD